jgi:biotin carboxylase
VLVLIGFADSLAAIEVAWNLLDHGWEVAAFSRAGTRPPLASSRRVRVFEVPAPEVDAAGCAAAIGELARRHGAAVVLPLDDFAVWACDRAGPVPVAGPTGALAEFALDKRLQVAAAEEAGFAVPPSGEGPWMVKPALAVVEENGRLTRPTGRLAASPDEARRVSEGIGGPVITQTMVSGVGEGVFGFGGASGIHALSGHRRVRMMNPRGSGSSACRSVDVAEDVIGPVERLMGKLGWQGMFMVELLRDRDGVPWFMEVNGRAWGSMVLAVRRGLDYPDWACRAMTEPDFEPPAVRPGKPIVARHLGRETVHLAAVLRGARGADAAAWPPRLRTLRQMIPRPGERWYNWRCGEARVFARDAWQTVAAQLLRRGKG